MSRLKHLQDRLTEHSLQAPLDPDISTLIDWALPLLSEVSEAAMDDIVSMISALAWRSDGETLAALLPKLQACDAVHRARLGRSSKTLWLHVAKHLDHQTVWRRLVEIMIQQDPTGRHAAAYAAKAHRRGAREPAIARMIVIGHLQHGRRSRAAWWLRRNRGCPDHAALLHLATQDAPLPSPLCRCAGHPDKTAAPPPTTWLKPFFSEGDSLYDTHHSLCLSCQTVWSEDEDYMSSHPTWARVPLSYFASEGLWNRGMTFAWPGAAIAGDPAVFLRWIRDLDEPMFSYGMV